MPTYKQLTTTNPEYEARFWHRCQRLYEGGRKLLADKGVMDEIFPMTNGESQLVYRERRKRAYHIPYAGSIIDWLVGSLFSQRVTLKSEPEADPFFAEFVANCAKPTATMKCDLDTLLRRQMTTALVKQTAWTLVDLPKVEPGANSLRDQEKAGALRAYALPVDPECVLDWQEDEDGELLWANVLNRSRRRATIMDDRSLIRDEFTVYGREGWQRYVAEYTDDKPYPESDDVPLLDEGPISGGAVPLVRLSLPYGQYAMGKVESMAVAHFNKRNGLSWAELKCAFPILASFLDAPTTKDMVNPSAENPNRDVNQPVGPGYMLRLAKGDDVRYITPDTAAFTTLLADINNLRDEKHRVLQVMSMSVDNSAAALQRSGESKMVDQGATSKLLTALGFLVREHAIGIVRAAERLRQDTPVEWSATGMDKYDDVDAGTLIEEETQLEAISMPSATFQVLRKMRLAQKYLGEEATDEDLARIRKEFEQNISNEQFALAVEAMRAATAQAEGETEPEKAKEETE